MKLVTPSAELLNPVGNPCGDTSKIARTCYKSEHKDDTSERFVKTLIKNGHEAMIEFVTLQFRCVTDRGVSHELVRHRMASYAQESTRYCDYEGKDLEFIVPSQILGEGENSVAYIIWCQTMAIIEQNYQDMRRAGVTPQNARSILPNSLKTEICVQMNMREFRHFLSLRTNVRAHPDMQVLANKMKEAVEFYSQYAPFLEREE